MFSPFSPHARLTFAKVSETEISSTKNVVKWLQVVLSEIFFSYTQERTRL